MNARFRLSAGIPAICAAALAIVLSIRTSVRMRKVETTAASVRTYANLVEARVAVTELAWGIALCAERTGRLPPSSSKVPQQFRHVQGVMYQSRLADWNDEAFKCADFHLARPQRFQYQWLLGAGDMQGQVVAEADYDGDGTVDHQVRLSVRCSTMESRLRCRPDAMATAPRPLGND